MLTNQLNTPRTVVIHTFDAKLRYQIQAMLTSAGHFSITLEQTEAVLDFCRDQLPDMLILDARNRDTVAFDLCRQIRALPSHTLTPILMITRGERPAIIATLECGASDYVSPPFVAAMLRYRIEHLLMHSRVRQALNRYENLVMNSADAMLSVDVDARIIGWNRAAERIYGWKIDEILGQNIESALKTRYPHHQTAADIQVHLAQQHYWRGDVVQCHKSGRDIYVTLAVTTVRDATGQIVEYLSTNRDITAQKQIEDALRVNEHQTESILRAMNELVIILDKNGRFVQIPSHDHPMLIRSSSELLGHLLEDVMPANHALYFRQQLDRTLLTRQTVSVEYSLTIKGDQRWFRGTMTAYEPERVALVVHDETESREAAQTLQETAARYQHLFEYANDAVLLIDALTGTVMDANRQASRALGYTHPEFLQLNISQIETQSEDIPHTDSLTVGLHSTGRLIMEQVYRRKNGAPLFVESSSRVITMNARSTILVFARDITDRKRAREAEREQRQLAEALRDTSVALSSSLALDDVLELILQNISALVRCDRSSIMLIEEAAARIVRHQGYEPEIASKLDDLRLELAHIRTLGWMFQHKQPLIVYDTRTDPLWTRGVVDVAYFSYLGAPIILKGEVIGFLNLDGKPSEHFKPEQADRLQAFASQVAIAIQNAQLYESSLRYAEQLEDQVTQRTAALSSANNALKQQIAERRDIEDALEEERKLLKTLIDNLPDHIYVKDISHRFILANKAVIEFMGARTMDDVRSQTNSDFYDALTAAIFDATEDRVIASGTVQQDGPSMIQSPRGEKRWLLGSQLPLRDARGQTIGIIGINRDISALKAAEETLAAERNLLRAVIDNIPDMIYVKDTERRFLMVNRATARELGIEKPEDAIGKTDYDYYPEDQAQEHHELEAQVLEELPVLNLDRQFTADDGNTYWELITKLPLRDANGQIVGLIGVNRDITELKQAEKQLQQVLNSARCLLWFALVEEAKDDFIWHMQIANEEAAQKFLPLDVAHTTYTEAWQNSIVTEDRERRRYVFRTYLKFNRLSYSQEVRCQQADGQIRWLTEDVQIRQLTPGRWSMVGVCTDITERKKAEDTLQRANDELERSVAARTHELMQTNLELRQEILERQRAEEAERHQHQLSEALRDSVAAINSSLDRNEVLRRILEAMQPVVPHDAANILLRDGEDVYVVHSHGYDQTIHGKRLRSSEFASFQMVVDSQQPLIIPDVHQFDGWQELPESQWVQSAMVVPIRLNRQIIGFLTLDSAETNHFTEDHARWLQTFANQASIAINNARLLEEIRSHADELQQHVDARTAELRHERAQLRAILDAMKDGVVYYDLDDLPQYINKAMIDIMHSSEAEWMRLRAGSQIYAMTRDEHRLLMERIDRGLQSFGIWRSDLLMLRADGTTFDANLTYTEVKGANNDRMGVVAVIRDISQGKQLEEQKKRFIADAAHELRTPIANLKVRLFLIRRQPEKFDEHIEVATKAADWMQRLIDNLFDIARFERGIIELKRETVILQQFLVDVVRFHEPEAERLGVRFSFEMPSEPLTAQIDPYRMTQVISNLVGNALHYTPENGIVTLEMALDMPTNEVVIRVRDTGIGIEPEHLPHVFQPFYRGGTVDNRGAGLGLSISQDIVRLHGGSISVASEFGAGTEFIVRLPVTELQVDL